MVEIDAQEFLEAQKVGPDRLIQGAELQKIFWRYKALEQELSRQKAFWKSTNDTLSQALLQVREKEQELADANHRLSQSYQELQALTNRLQQELALARHIQQSLLPPGRPAWSGPSLCCACIPAYEVGGDFYAYHRLDGQRFALAVGDVSDKGMAAALFMAISLAYFDAIPTLALPPQEVLTHLDRALLRYTQATRQNCALCYVEIDGLNLRVANAGGIPPYVRRSDGRVEWLKVGGMPLGIEIASELGYEALTTTVDPQDVVILTSDGVIEAADSSGKMFGFLRLQQAIAAGPASDPKAMLDHLMAEIRAFVGEAPPRDDVTIVVLQARG